MIACRLRRRLVRKHLARGCRVKMGWFTVFKISTIERNYRFCALPLVATSQLTINVAYVYYVCT